MPKASQKMKATRVRQGVASLSVLMFSNQTSGVVLPQRPVNSKSGLRVRSFNLEGRGGNKDKSEGSKVEKDLETYLNALHKQRNAPHVILTQEDIDKEVKGYKVVAECVAEQYWCDQQQGINYGDGCDGEKEEKDRRMRNRVYVKTESEDQENAHDLGKFRDQSQSFIVTSNPLDFAPEDSEKYSKRKTGMGIGKGKTQSSEIGKVFPKEIGKSPVSVVMTRKLTGDNLQKLNLDKTENEIKAGAFNPRCVAIAVNAKTGMAFASFHLSGGSSDDVAARHWMKEHKYAPTLKQDELQLLAGYVSDGNNGISYAIAGGDTNGLTGEKATVCTGQYCNEAPEIFAGFEATLWTEYQTIPDSLSLHHDSGKLVRLFVSNNDNSGDADLVSSSSSIYGGVVDHFYMFQNPESPQISSMPTVAILPVGLSVSEKGGRLQRELSDHNPIEVVLPIDMVLSQ